MSGWAVLFPAILAASAAAAPAPPNSAQVWDARLSSFQGDVEVRLPGQDWFKPKEPMPLDRGDEIRVGKTGFAEISFGASGLVLLKPGSYLQLSDLDQGKTWLDLKAGTLLEKLKSLKSLRSLFGRNFSWAVRTPSAVCSVRGTEFAVSLSPDGATTAGVFSEGEVELSSSAGGVKKLAVEQEAVVHPGGPVGEIGRLRALAGYRQSMRTLRSHLAALERRYRSLPVEKRRRLREAVRGRR